MSVSIVPPLPQNPRGYFHIKRSGGGGGAWPQNLPPKIWITNTPNFALWVSGITPNAPKTMILSQVLRVVVTEFPMFFLFFGELGRTLPQFLPLNLMSGPGPPPPNMELPPDPELCKLLTEWEYLTINHCWCIIKLMLTMRDWRVLGFAWQELKLTTLHRKIVNRL